MTTTDLNHQNVTPVDLLTPSSGSNTPTTQLFYDCDRHLPI